jgi:hypothetical protein
MGTKEQRFATWGAFLCAAATLLYGCHLERDRFQSPFAPSLGLTWEQQRLTAPGDRAVYCDKFTVTNEEKVALKNIGVKIENYVTCHVREYTIGDLGPGESKPLRIGVADPSALCSPDEVGLNDVDVLIVPLHAHKRVPVKDVGKQKLLRDVEREENRAKGWPDAPVPVKMP